MNGDDLQPFRLFLYERDYFLSFLERFEIQKHYVWRMGAKRAHQVDRCRISIQHSVDGDFSSQRRGRFQAKRQFNVRADDDAAKQIRPPLIA